jgi:TRAP-type C4-dicarboxylate transport system substrate-binding protein
MLEWVESAGGVPLSMPSGEVYVAIQRGVADGGITGSASAISAAWYEVAPYAHLIHFFYVITDLAISQASFDALPEEYQTILLEEGKNFTENFKMQLNEEDASAWDIWKSKGGEVIELTPAQAADLKEMATPLWDSWLQQTSPEGREAFEAIKQALGI